MKIPKFLKQLCKVCDTESSRYALGGVKVESDGATGSLTATDGRILCNVSFPDTIGPVMDMIIDGKQATRAVTHCVTKDGLLSVGPAETNPDKFANICGQQGGSSVELVEGKFPRYRELFDIAGNESKYRRIRLDPKLLIKLLEVYAAAVDKDAYGSSKGVDVWIKGGEQDAVFLSHTTPAGQVIRSIIMPLEVDVTEDISHYPAESGASPKPEAAKKPSKPQKQHTAVAAPSVDMSALDAIPVAPLS
jgi:hypothetical protein